MTPEAAQDLQAYFGMEIFGDDDDEDDKEQNFDMEEQKLRRVIREEIKRTLTEESDSEWFQVARLMSDLARERREVKDVGQKQIGGETVHEIAINDRVYQIRKVQ